MTQVTAWTVDPAVVSRDLTPAEVADLDALRFALARAVDRTEPRAIAWLWDKVIAESAGAPAPAGFVEAVAAALGDLLAVHVPTAHWSVWPGPGGPTLGVVSAARPTAPVVPFLDARDKWDAGARDWVVDYVARAAAHLAAATVPNPHPAPHDEVARPAATPAAVDVADEPAPRPEPAPLPRREPSRAPAVPAPDATVAPDVVSMPAPDVASAATSDVAFGAPSDVASAPAPDATPAAGLDIAPAPSSSGTASPPAPNAAPVTAGIAPVAPSSGIASAPAPDAAPAATPGIAPAPASWVPDESLRDFALATLDHAVTVLRQVGAFDREAFVVLVGGGGRRTETCPGEPSEALATARSLVAASGAPRAAVAWIERTPHDLPGPQQRFPAVLVDAWEAGEGLRVAHRFVDDMLGTDTLGDPLVVGPADPLL